MNTVTRCARSAAAKYAQERFLVVDFQLSDIGLSDEAVARILDTIHEELIKAWLSGCAAGSDPKEAA